MSQGLHYLTLGFNASYHDVQSRSSPGVALVCTWSKTSGKRRCTKIASHLICAISYGVKKLFTRYIQSGDTIINRSVVSSHISVEYLFLRFLPIIYFTSKINLYFGFRYSVINYQAVLMIHYKIYPILNRSICLIT